MSDHKLDKLGRAEQVAVLVRFQDWIGQGWI